MEASSLRLCRWHTLHLFTLVHATTAAWLHDFFCYSCILARYESVVVSFLFRELCPCDVFYFSSFLLYCLLFPFPIFPCFPCFPFSPFPLFSFSPFPLFPFPISRLFPKTFIPRPSSQDPIPRPHPKTPSQDPIPRSHPKIPSQNPTPRSRPFSF